MKKFLSIMTCALLAVSCIIDSGDHIGRTEDEIVWRSESVLRMALDMPLEGFYQSMRLQEFLNADDQERKDSKYSDIAYYYSDDCYEIKEFGRITPDGNQFSSEGAVWTVRCDTGTYTLQALSDRSWKMAPDKNASYWNLSCEFNLSFILEDEALGPKSKFKGTLEGSASDGTEYHIDFRSTDSFDFNWHISNVQGDTAHHSTRVGQIRLEFKKDKELLDWCTADFDGRTDYNPVYRTSLTQ